MINRDKYAEYLDSALIHKLINGLDPKLSKKIFSLKFRPPFLASGQRYFDVKYQKQGMFLVRNKKSKEIIRIGFSDQEVRNSMYRYLGRLPSKEDSDCAILLTHNGEQKEISLLMKRVMNFEIEYHNYFLLKEEIEGTSSGKIEVEKLEKLFPYTGRCSSKNKEGKEWSISQKKWKSGIYLIWKDGEIDYIGKGKLLTARLYSHFHDKSQYIENHPNGRQYTHRHVYYPPEEIEQGRIMVSTIPIYRKVVPDIVPWNSSDKGEMREEKDEEFFGRISGLEKRLISFYKPPMNTEGVQDDYIGEDNSRDMEKVHVVNPDELEDPPF